MSTGSYVLRFRGVDKKYLEQLGDAHIEETADLLARSRRLSADTAKRRKALALKRKLEAQKEEKRRQEILQKRREQIREATEKYQRGNKNYSTKDYEQYDRYKTPTLDEALSAVRGRTTRRVSSASRVSHRSYSAVMASGGVAHVRASSAGSITSKRSARAAGISRPHAAHYDYTGNKDHGQVQLCDHSRHNLNNSRSLFEQQLQHHQQLIVEQQKQSLHQFNAAIQDEMERDPKLQGVEQVEELDIRPDSPDSVDSLESPESQNMKGSTENAEKDVTPQTNIKPGDTSEAHHLPTSQSITVPTSYSERLTQYPVYANASFSLHNLHSSQSPIAVVQPQVHGQANQCSGDTAGKKLEEDKVAGHGYEKYSVPLKMMNTGSNDKTNGQHCEATVFSCTNEVQSTAASTAMKENIPLYQHTDCESSSKTKARAWVLPSPYAVLETDIAEKKDQQFQNNRMESNRISQYQPVHHTNEVIDTNTVFVSAQQKASPVIVSSSVVTPQRPVTSCMANGMTHFTITQQNAAGARPLPVTSVIISTATVNSQQQQPQYITASAAIRPSMEILKQYSQFPMFRTADAQEAGDQSSQISDASTLTSGSDMTEESQPEPAKTCTVRGILKKVSSYGPPLPNQSNTINHGRSQVLTRSMSAHTGLRDSLEITKLKKQQPVKLAKRVRFADQVYNDDSDSENNQPQNKPSVVSQKPPARPGAQRTNNVKSKIPRASSASTDTRQPLMCPHPPTHPPTGRAVMSRNNQKPSSNLSEKQTGAINNKVHDLIHSDSQNCVTNATDTNTEHSKSSAVYDVNGMRLDRTPTDEEINHLWDKVRTCLSRQSNTSNAESIPPRNNSTSTVPTPAVSQKHLDGSCLMPQFRVAPRVNSTYTNNYMGTGTVANTQTRKKVSMDVLNNFTRRQNLLNQRNKQSAPRPADSISQIPVTMTTHLINPTTESANYITTSVGSLPHQNINHSVSESLAAFLAAENLTKESVSDSQIEAAMDQAMKEQQVLNSINAQPRVPTALSIEEQRLMQSLERLNERLRLNETQMYPVSFAPNPPYHAGFKGHQPITSTPATKRQVSNNGTVPRHTYRSGSAPVQRMTNYNGPYRYR